MTQLNQPFQVASGDGIDDASTIGVDPTMAAGLGLLSDASLDALWAELEGDLVPDTTPAVLGPFEGDDPGADLWIEYTEINVDVTVTIDVTEVTAGVLLPTEVDAGYGDPFMLPVQDWCECTAYDPMAAPTDWTVAGYTTFDDPFALPGSDVLYPDAGMFYDSYDPGAGYWDTSSYYDTTGEFLDTPDVYGAWDDLSYMPTGQSDYVDTTFDTFDATSTWDPNAGDAAHDAFIDTITEDYSSGYADPSDWSSSDSSQFWMDEYNAAEDLSWDAWNNSVDASLAGDEMGAYDWNQQSLDWASTADDAWDASSSYSSDWSSDYSSDF